MKAERGQLHLLSNFYSILYCEQSISVGRSDGRALRGLKCRLYRRKPASELPPSFSIVSSEAIGSRRLF